MQSSFIKGINKMREVKGPVQDNIYMPIKHKSNTSTCICFLTSFKMGFVNNIDKL